MSVKSETSRTRSTFGLMGFIASIAVIGLLPAVILKPVYEAEPIDPDNINTDGLCLTVECINTAAAVLDKMHIEANPCDDFYEFACGTYVATESVPEDKSRVDIFSVTTDKLQEQLFSIIMEDLPETEPKHVRLPNLLYKACTNTDLIETLGSTPMSELADSLGGWPLLLGDAWDLEDTWTWQDTIKRFRHMGFSMDLIIDFSISVDLGNSTKRVLDLDQPEFGLDREYLINGFNESLVTAYYYYMVDIAVLFGAEEEQAKKELLESLYFEMDLANISWPNELRRNFKDLYNLRTIRSMQEAYPYMDWLDYINGLLPPGLVVEEDEVVNLPVPMFMADLGALLARTPKRVIANYLMWRIHSFSTNFLSEAFRSRLEQYNTVLTGSEKREARWKECVGVTSGSSTFDGFEDGAGLSIAVGSLYVRKYFNEDSKRIAFEMVNNIRAVYGNVLSEVDWMDSATKKEAERKLYAMRTYVGYPDELLDNDKLAAYYENLTVDPDKYLESMLKMNVEARNYAFNKLREPLDKTEWMRYARPAVVNAYYSLIDNSIQFPAGILQGRFFNAERPKYMNYGSIGFIIGHEITHGFDNQGSLFDLHGDLVEWWQKETRSAFLEKARCVIEQYGNFTDDTTGLNVNGINTQDENIADNGGAKESYIAYKQWAEKNGPELKLPGLDFSPEQMFWIAAAQTWCSKERKEALKMRITTDVHSPSQFRVLGSFSNMKNFANDFQCPLGSPMNPEHKCEVW